MAVLKYPQVGSSSGSRSRTRNHTAANPGLIAGLLSKNQKGNEPGAVEAFIGQLRLKAWHQETPMIGLSLSTR
ncbi:unnamed protein product [Thlaspi arvense]|uniref:Uncharacterized protein n=1 Tax=Thlaspi arvense TaxID=13288 RepID=A0AAU9S1J6_THLAR|nr:unnamed protein product [Thlaspi arvense]